MIENQKIDQSTPQTSGLSRYGPFLSQGFDGVKFLCDAENYRLRKAIGIAGMAEIKAQCEFEDADVEGNA